jgi:hypothetical protein
MSKVAICSPATFFDPASVPRSRTSVSTPFYASVAAAAAPPGPQPTTTAS